MRAREPIGFLPKPCSVAGGSKLHSMAGVTRNLKYKHFKSNILHLFPRPNRMEPISISHADMGRFDTQRSQQPEKCVNGDFAGIVDLHEKFWSPFSAVKTLCNG